MIGLTCLFVFGEKKTHKRKTRQDKTNQTRRLKICSSTTNTPSFLVVSNPCALLLGLELCKVYANNDLGLLNFRLHPDWPETPYGYMLYAHDRG